MDILGEEEPATLNMLAEKIVPHPLDPEHLAYCPTMDLLAVATIDGKMSLYRLNGQRVLGGPEKWQTSKPIRGLRWKPDGTVCLTNRNAGQYSEINCVTGKLLAVAREDGNVRLISVETGKVRHTLACPPSSSGKITCLGWGVNLIEGRAVQHRIKESGHTFTLDDILGRVSHEISQDAIPDLPRDLALFDVDEMLPKLSVLPSGGKDEDIFGSRVSMDSIFHPLSKKEDDTVDLLIIGFSDGSLQICIYDSFVIGSIQLRPSGMSDEYRLISHAFHPYCSTHTILAAAKTARGSKELSLIALDMQFISSSNQYLSLLASKSTQLQNLLRYIHQTQNQMHIEWKSSQDLPKKFIRNINETLEESNQGTLVQAAYHLVATGHCFPVMKAWLVEELTERGHKRWDKAVTNGYESIRRLTHENLLPALERCSVLVSRLNGLSKYQESNAKLGLSSQELENILDAINCLSLAAHNILIHTNTELEQFTAFSKWLRHEIDVQGTNTDANTEEDGSEKDPMIEHAKVLRYIQGAMTESRLTGFLDSASDGDPKQLKDLNHEGSLYQHFNDRIREYNRFFPRNQTMRLPGLNELCAYLTQQCEVVFRRIAKAEQRNVHSGAPILLERDFDSRVLDMRMLYHHVAEQTQCIIYVAVGSSLSSDTLHVYRIVLDVSNGISSTNAVERSTIFYENGSIKDAKLIDNERMMLIVHGNQKARAAKDGAGYTALLSIPFNVDLEDPHRLRYSKWTAGATCNEPTEPEQVLDLSNSETLRQYLQHSFPESDIWVPERLEVNGRRGRRAACVLGTSRIHYKIFDINSEPSEEDVDGEGMQE